MTSPWRTLPSVMSIPLGCGGSAMSRFPMTQFYGTSGTEAHVGDSQVNSASISPALIFVCRQIHENQGSAPPRRRRRPK